ncbi:MAG: sulfatase-like hydrolase/transferase [Candidatus Micrarchaeia archaeon]
MKQKKPNIAIIVLDTVRFDTFTNLMHEAKEEFTSIGSFAEVKKCIAPASWTLPTHASIFTGMYPNEHGVHETKTISALDIEAIKLKKETFLDDLRTIGYRTYGISANPYVNPVYGFRGFDVFKEETYFTDLQGYAIEVPKKLKPFLAKYRKEYGGSFFKIAIAMLRDDPSSITKFANLPLVGALTLKNLAKKLKERTVGSWPLEKGGKNAVGTIEGFKLKRPFFLFLNLMEAHEPYIGKKSMDFDGLTPFRKKQPGKELIELWKHKYVLGTKKAIYYAHKVSKYLLENFSNTIVIITSDHGQEFGEHGFIGHGVRLDYELVHVPFIVYTPKWMKRIESDSYASLVNVKNFINAAVNMDPESMKQLYSKEVYSENFGALSNIVRTKALNEDLDFKKLNMYNKYHRRTFRS